MLIQLNTYLKNINRNFPKANLVTVYNTRACSTIHDSREEKKLPFNHGYFCQDNQATSPVKRKEEVEL